MFKCFNVWLFKGSTSSRWTTSSRRASSRPERRRRPWSDSLTFKPCLTREWRSFLRMRWGVLLSSSRSRRSTCEYLLHLSSAFWSQLLGLQTNWCCFQSTQWLSLFQDHSEQMHDQLHEPEGWFWGFEQIPKDLMHKGELS